MWPRREKHRASWRSKQSSLAEPDDLSDFGICIRAVDLRPQIVSHVLQSHKKSIAY